MYIVLPVTCTLYFQWCEHYIIGGMYIILQLKCTLNYWWNVHHIIGCVHHISGGMYIILQAKCTLNYWRNVHHITGDVYTILGPSTADQQQWCINHRDRWKEVTLPTRTCWRWCARLLLIALIGKGLISWKAIWKMQKATISAEHSRNGASWWQTCGNQTRTTTTTTTCDRQRREIYNMWLTMTHDIQHVIYNNMWCTMACDIQQHVTCNNMLLTTCIYIYVVSVCICLCDVVLLRS